MIDGVARLVGSSPDRVDYFQRGDLEIFRVDPPLCGYRIIAASQSPVCHARAVGRRRRQLPRSALADPLETASA
ncbi:hypothetical protein [Mycolicibacterium sp. P9-64]|uniref:hypothetical protein n=1 Tax=Mycolicibacterium sp. P9-64 TaxID=2024612 RepID=UPI0011EC27EF|nr:hypothetical protein [Mycolicibacterium sp. P9-64]